MTRGTRTSRGNGREGRSMRRAREYANDCSNGISAARAHVTFVGVVVPWWGSGPSDWARSAPTLHTLYRRLEGSSPASNMAINAPRSVLGEPTTLFSPPAARQGADDAPLTPR